MAFPLGMAAVLSLGLAFRLPALHRDLWFDEYASWSLASGDRALIALITQNVLPLYYGLLSLWSQLGSSEAHLRLLSVLFSLAAIGLFLHWERRHTFAAVIGALWLTTHPYFRIQGTEIRAYSLAYLACFAAWWYAQQPSAKRFKWLLGLLAVLAHPLGVFALPVLYFFPTGERRGHLTAHWMAAFLVPVGIASLLGPFTQAYLKLVRSYPALTDGAFLEQWISALGWPHAPHIPPWWHSLPQRFPHSQWAALTVAIASAVAGAATLRRAPFPGFLWLAAGCGYLGSLVTFSLAFQSLIHVRTLLPGTLALGVGALLALGSSPRYRWALGLLALPLLYSNARIAYPRAAANNEGFAAVERLLLNVRRPQDPLVLLPAVLGKNGVGRYYAKVPRRQTYFLSPDAPMTQWGIKGTAFSPTGSQRVYLISRGGRAHRKVREWNRLDLLGQWSALMGGKIRLWRYDPHPAPGSGSP